MSIKIAITNEKGGCGKTTSAVNISAILAERGYRVLLADVDPQSYATMYYGLYNTDDPSLYDAITGVWPVNDAIVKTVFGVDVLKSNTKLMKLEEMLTEYKLRGRAYNDLLSKLLTPIESDYDYIIIDCPPQGYKLLENVQRYADYILIPMIPDEFALHSLTMCGSLKGICLHCCTTPPKLRRRVISTRSFLLCRRKNTSPRLTSNSTRNTIFSIT